jgi:hypothetical protein
MIAPVFVCNMKKVMVQGIVNTGFRQLRIFRLGASCQAAGSSLYFDRNIIFLDLNSEA